MAWLFLFLAGIFEVVWSVGLKYSDNLTKLVPSMITLVALCLSLWLLSLALKSLPLGTAYAVWTGIGTLGAAIVGVLVFHEPLGILRMISFMLIVMGILGLKLVS